MTRKSNRREFLKNVGKTAVIGGAATGMTAAFMVDEVQAQSIRTRQLPHPELDFWSYRFSANLDDICYWFSSGCVYMAVVTAATQSNPAISGFIVVCASGAAGCQLREDANRLSDDESNFEWGHVYDIAGGTNIIPRLVAAPNDNLDGMGTGLDESTYFDMNEAGRDR